MSYYINAWLENGDPQLQIIDAQSKAVSVSWSYKAAQGGNPEDRHEIQRLFRALLLLTCKQAIARQPTQVGNDHLVSY